ncbi:MAG: ATP-dependent Clp protease proteolytic subunit [Dehalococcoidia bacterium]|jgi:ATP-dependent Clp protease, protease subunit|nr:ATP-dependent Clp protease proteolytic subunit [Dehalococcoidia bacterium]
MPMVVETGPRGERAYDIYSLMLKERVIYLGTGIDSDVSNTIVAQLLWLDREEPDRDISLYVNSPGGEIYSGLAIIDTMNLIRAEVSTIAVGITASMGTAILAAGEKGKRFALPSATIHMHQALGGAQGQSSDVQIQARELNRLNDHMRTFLAERTGRPFDEISKDFDRDRYMDAEEAVEYGLIDGILEQPASTGESRGGTNFTTGSTSESPSSSGPATS